VNLPLVNHKKPSKTTLGNVHAAQLHPDKSRLPELKFLDDHVKRREN
jgi:hypothetical protein